MTKPRRERLTVLDTMKGLAMIFVIFDHCGFALHPVIDHIEVPVFYLISGYLFSSSSDFRDFLWRKAYTLLVPYVVFASLYALPYMSKGVEAGVIGHIVNLLAQPANYPLWFIKALFWSLLGYYWILRAIADRPIWVEAAVNICLAATVCILVTITSFNEKVLITGLPQGAEALPLIGFGHLTARLTAKYPVRAHRKVYAALVAVAIPAAYFAAVDGIRLNISDIGKSIWLFYPCVAACGVVFAALCLCISRVTPLNYVGRHSVSFFGFHAIAIFIIVQLFAMPPLLLPLAAALLCVPVAEIWRKCFSIHR